MNTLKRYFQESFEEFHKVTWPTRQQSLRISIIVIVFTAISALVLGLVDELLTLLYQLVL